MTEEEFWAALAPVTTTLPTYRLYYGDHGEPLFYSQENLPGKYLVIDHATYSNPPTHCCVVDGVLKILNPSAVTKLVPADVGTPCHPHDISVVVDVTDPHTQWILK